VVLSEDETREVLRRPFTACEKLDGLNVGFSFKGRVPVAPSRVHGVLPLVRADSPDRDVAVARPGFVSTQAPGTALTLLPNMNSAGRSSSPRFTKTSPSTYAQPVRSFCCHPAPNLASMAKA
jgi:hypothetical protein